METIGSFVEAIGRTKSISDPNFARNPIKAWHNVRRLEIATTPRFAGGRTRSEVPGTPRVSSLGSQTRSKRVEFAEEHFQDLLLGRVFRLSLEGNACFK